MKIGFLVCVDDEIEKNQMFGIRYMPVWAYTLASYIREIPEAEMFLYDTRFEKREQTPQADVFFISGINQDYASLIKYEQLLRKLHPLAKLIIGGPITLSYQLVNKLDTLMKFDHIFVGDGEFAIKKVIVDLMEGNPLKKIIENHKKFYLNESRAIDFKLLQENHQHYYGGVLEVSRGCPFLCEFCDIRTKPDNNTANNKSIDVIITELDQFLNLGIKDILMACDNFIGNHVWAEQLCDRIIEWKNKTSHQPHFYTWLTVNLVYHPKLMDKMKLAGFDMFFIGIESFGMDQLMETAKLQNTKTDMTTCIQTIQSRGFIVVAGLIFGFDTDPEDAVQVALDGIKKSGLISGDPSLLTALPGTPLHRRMEKSGRLRESKIGLGGQKYVTNILYLRDREALISDFIFFVEEFNKPKYQFERFQSFLSSLNYTPTAKEKSSNYINLGKLWDMIYRNPKAIISVIKRFSGVINTPGKIYYVSKALFITLKSKHARMSYFYFWLFNWSNSVLKYGNLARSDFDIDSISKNYNLNEIIPSDYETDYFEPIPLNKIKAQRQATIRTLKKVILNR